MIANVDLGALAAVNPWIVLLAGFLIHLVIVFNNPSPLGGFNWGLFFAPIALAAFVFGTTLLTGRNPNGLHVPNGGYWRSPEHYPQAMAHIQTALAWLTSLMGIFVDFATIMAIRAKRSPSGNPNALKAIGLVLFFVAAMSIFVGIIGAGWDIPAR
jgi:hypothetical protein